MVLARLLLLLLVNRRSSCRFRLLRATAALVEVVPLIVRVVVSACRLVVWSLFVMRHLLCSQWMIRVLYLHIIRRRGQ